MQFNNYILYCYIKIIMYLHLFWFINSLTSVSALT